MPDLKNTIWKDKTPIELLRLNPKTYNALLKANIGTIQELVSTICSLKKIDAFCGKGVIRGIGKMGWNEIKENLTSFNIKI